ncbi:unnamed protein product [Mortierella alpina]
MNDTRQHSTISLYYVKLQYCAICGTLLYSSEVRFLAVPNHQYAAMRPFYGSLLAAWTLTELIYTGQVGSVIRTSTRSAPGGFMHRVQILAWDK